MTQFPGFVRSARFLFLLGCTFPNIPWEASARLIQIVHTNDLHSHLDHAEDPALGGYAAVKAVMDQLRAGAEAQGIETLTLDAGDFTEGSEFYLADRGAETWRAMNAMGYDAVTLGNHDWFLGERGLDEIVGRVPPNFPLLAANFIFSSSSHHLTHSMRQWVELKRAGLRIAILGLTTSDIQYEWMMEGSGGFINGIEEEAKQDIPRLRARNDLVIALTHIGVDADKRLVQHIGGLDLVVGGHSHTLINTPVLVRDPYGRTVPLVQGGMHGEQVGDLLIDFEPGHPLKIVHYKMVPVPSNGPKNLKLTQILDQANARLEQDYGRDWSNEVIGVSEVPLENAWRVGHPTIWGNFAAEAMRSVTGAEAAVDASEFTGQSQPAGPITRRQLFILYPRVFDLSQRRGWNVWTVNITGWALKFALETAYKQGVALNLSGITFDSNNQAGTQPKMWNIQINGQAIQTWRSYRVALPEGIIRGGYGISKLLKAVLRKPRDSGIPIWEATEKHFREIGTIHARGN